MILMSCCGMSNRSVEGHLRGFALLGVGRFSRTWTGLANPATLVRNTALRPQGHKVILETAFEWFIVVIQDAVKFCWTLEAKCHLRVGMVGSLMDDIAPKLDGNTAWLHLFQLRGSQHEFLSRWNAVATAVTSQDQTAAPVSKETKAGDGRGLFPRLKSWLR